MRQYVLDPDEAREIVALHGGIRPAARNTGYSFGAIYGALRRGNEGTSKPVQDETVENNERDMRRLQAEITRLRGRLKAAESDEDSAERIRETIWQIEGRSPNPPRWVTDSKPQSGIPGVPVTLWSDWHWSEVVMKEEVNGLNEFNSQVAHRRSIDLVEKVVDLTQNHMVNPNYPGIVAALGGDMISGDIHEELRDTNDVYLLPSCLDVQDHIAANIERLADTFGSVFVPCVPGNHGRGTLKPRFKGRAYTSFEWNIYCQLERYFRDDDRVQFLISNEADAHFRVYDHKFLLTHGDALGVKGGDGIIGAIGPIMRGTTKVGRAESQIGQDFDTIMMGHWHQYLPLPGIVVNGALKGYDEFARLALRAPYARPSQALFFVHPKHGITAQWPVYLEPRPTSPSPWISWRAA